jgi:hypothetical protein
MPDCPKADLGGCRCKTFHGLPLCRIFGRPTVYLVVCSSVAMLFYLVDCAMAIILDIHPELPWYWRGVHVGGPGGYLLTFLMLIITPIVTVRAASEDSDKNECDACARYACKTKTLH